VKSTNKKLEIERIVLELAHQARVRARKSAFETRRSSAKSSLAAMTETTCVDNFVVMQINQPRSAPATPKQRAHYKTLHSGRGGG
jgi:hypothetical protein